MDAESAEAEQAIRTYYILGTYSNRRNFGLCPDRAIQYIVVIRRNKF